MRRLVQLHDPGIESAAPATEPWPIAGATHALRVYFYTAPWALQHPGGGEVQLWNTARSLRAIGVDVKLFDPWSDRLEQAEWLHLFGTLPECLGMARAAAQCGVKVALSPISWYDPEVSAHLEPTLGRKLRGVSAWLARRAIPALPSWRRELIRRADVLLPNSAAEARQLEMLFGAEPARVAVVPNGVDERFACGDARLFEEQFGVRDFVLLPGRVEPRKNQLRVIQALWGSGVPLVVLGEPHPDFAAYYRACAAAADPAVIFVGHLPHDSPMLAAAYAAARVVVLASWFETPGLAALEGGLAGAQLVVTARGCTREYFGDSATYVEPGDAARIRAAVRAAMSQLKQTNLQQHIRKNYLWEQVARATRAAYTGTAAVAARESHTNAAWPQAA